MGYVDTIFTCCSLQLNGGKLVHSNNIYLKQFSKTPRAGCSCKLNSLSEDKILAAKEACIMQHHPYIFVQFYVLLYFVHIF
jgi:hypothetical protein